MLPPLDEAPLAAAALVDVVVTHRDHKPPVAVLVFGAAIHRSGRVVRVDEIELVAADQVDAAVEPPKYPVVPTLQRIPAVALRAGVDVVDEQRHQRVEIPGVEGHRVSTGQLADRETRFDPVQTIASEPTPRFCGHGGIVGRKQRMRTFVLVFCKGYYPALMPFPKILPTIPALVRSCAARFGDKPFLIADGQELTYIDLDRRSAALAIALLAEGISKGDHVGILMPNSVDWALAWFATTRIGAVAVPLNTFTRRPNSPGPHAMPTCTRS